MAMSKEDFKRILDAQAQKSKHKPATLKQNFDTLAKHVVPTAQKFLDIAKDGYMDYKVHSEDKGTDSDYNSYSTSNQNVPSSVLKQVNQDGLKQLDAMIGLKSVKYQVKCMLADHKYDQKIGAKYPNLPKPAMNMVFEGNPGTGKTEVAKLVGKIMYQNHICANNHFVKISGGDFESSLIGQDVRNVDRCMRRALGGVLFIDEAYSLTPNDGQGTLSESKKQIIDQLIQDIDDPKYRGHMIIIMAGYTNLMENFLSTNPGIRSRFNVKIHFPDYSLDELFDIFKYHAKKTHDIITPQGYQLVRSKLGKFVSFAKKNKNNGNGRMIRNLVWSISQQRNLRNMGKMSQLSLEQASKINDSDIKHGFISAYHNNKVLYDKMEKDNESHSQKEQDGMYDMYQQMKSGADSVSTDDKAKK